MRSRLVLVIAAACVASFALAARAPVPERPLRPGQRSAAYPLERSGVDHLGLTYPDLNAVIAHLKSKNVPILQGPYTLGDTRAVLIEDPDGLALELIEARK